MNDTNWTRTSFQVSQRRERTFQCSSPVIIRSAESAKKVTFIPAKFLGNYMKEHYLLIGGPYSFLIRFFPRNEYRSGPLASFFPPICISPSLW